MSCELSCRMTPLPQLCRNASGLLTGKIKTVFLLLAQELEQQVAPDAVSCMRAVQASVNLPDSVQDVLTQLGNSLGSFDLSGQLRGIESCLKNAQSKLRYQRSPPEPAAKLPNPRPLRRCRTGHPVFVNYGY